MPATTELLQEGRYRINQEFANDGNSNVYEAYDTVRDTNVVVKEIPLRLNKVTTVSQQEVMKLAFASQAKTLTEIHHDSLLHVQDFFSETGRQYLVMESVDGDDLGALLERNNSSFPVSDVLNWADQMLDALSYLHNFKPPIIHRNVRPEHVKLNSEGKIKLLAFGLTEGDESNVNTALSANDADAADICYAPLEQIWEGLDAASQKVITNSYDEKSEKVLKQPADARSDIYSLGATLYHLLTAVKPMDALERSIDVMEGKVDPLRDPAKANSSIPVEVSDVLVKALSIKREERFDSASIMRQVLRTAMVRSKEREAEEAREQMEAAEDLILAQQSRQAPQNDPAAADAKKLEMEAQQRRENELMKEQLRQAEERAAEAEKRLREQEAANAVKAAQVTAATNPEDDLLEILVSPVQNSTVTEISEVQADTAEVAEAEEDAVQHIDEPVEDVQVMPAEAVAILEEKVETVAYNDPIVEEIEAVESGSAVVEEDHEIAYVEPVSYKEEVKKNIGKAAKSSPAVQETPAVEIEEPVFEAKTGNGLPFGIPVLIGLGAAVVLIVIVAAWVLMPSNSGTAENPAQTPAVATEAPASDQNAQSALPSETSPTETATDVVSPTEPTVQRLKKPTPTPKPLKTTVTKKAVTADDLINDN